MCVLCSGALDDHPSMYVNEAFCLVHTFHITLSIIIDLGTLYVTQSLLDGYTHTQPNKGISSKLITSKTPQLMLFTPVVQANRNQWLQFPFQHKATHPKTVVRSRLALNPTSLRYPNPVLLLQIITQRPAPSHPVQFVETDRRVQKSKT